MSPIFSSSPAAKDRNFGSSASPEVVALVAEILQPEPHRPGVGDQVGAPVVEDLQPAEVHVRFLDVDPVVGRQAVAGRVARAATAGQHSAHHQSDRHEVAVGQSASHTRRWHLRLQLLGQRVQRHRGDERIAFDPACHAGGCVQHLRRLHTGPDLAQTDDPMVQMDFAAAPRLLRHGLPHLAWAEVRVQEPLDQARFHVLLRNARIAPDSRLQCVGERPRNRQSLDPLRTPFRGDLVAGNAPDLLRIVLEKCAIKTIAKSIDEEVLERRLGVAWEVARRDSLLRSGPPRPGPGSQRIRIQFQRVIEESSAVVDP